MPDSCLVLLEGASKVYETEDVLTRAVSSVDLEIRTEEFVTIAGPSGCGKTTLLSILGLLDFQSVSVIGDLSVRENVQPPLS